MISSVNIKGQLKQIFLYITLQCNCRCITCYMHKHYSPDKEMPFERAKDILKKYHSYGARKLTLLGGEPTLCCYLDRLVKFAKDTGYSYVRIQTNGQFDYETLTNPLIRENVDVLCFSIDGHTEDFNRNIRKGCSLNKTLENMRIAKELSYDVRVNFTITSININHIFDIISVAEKNGPTMIYLNSVFSMGLASDKPYLEVRPEQWVNTFNKINNNSHKFKVKIKAPVGYTYYDPVDHCCIAFKMSRLYVMPNGDAYPCILFIDKPDLQIDVNQYRDKLTSYVKASYKEINMYCHFLPPYDNELKPLCLYYRKIFGDHKQ